MQLPSMEIERRADFGRSVSQLGTRQGVLLDLPMELSGKQLKVGLELGGKV